MAFSEPPPFRLVRCNECGLLYRNPVERSHELTEIYARNTSAPDVLRALHDTQLPAVRVQARELRRALGRGGSGLEVGSYVGAFLAAARDEGLQVQGLDVNADVNAFTRSMGFTVHDGELANFATDQTFDAVAIWNTFDQLADPRGCAARGEQAPARRRHPRVACAERRVLRSGPPSVHEGQPREPRDSSSPARAKQPADVSVSMGLHAAIVDAAAQRNRLHGAAHSRRRAGADRRSLDAPLGAGRRNPHQARDGARGVVRGQSERRGSRCTLHPERSEGSRFSVRVRPLHRSAYSELQL